MPKNDIFWKCNKKIIEGKIFHNYTDEETIFKDFESLDGSSLGLILIIDHLKNPYHFLKEFIRRKVKNIFILVEKELNNNGLPVQHLTSWNYKSLNNLALNLGCNAYFPEIRTDKYIYTIFKYEN